jgi:hypothetical protein
MAVAQAEGALLNMLAGANNDADHVCVVAECIADGAVNTIVRLKGNEHASIFAFALADRVAGGLRQPTELHVMAVAKPTPAPAPTKKRWPLSWADVGDILARVLIFTSIGVGLTLLARFL